MTDRDESSVPILVKLCSDKAAFEVRTRKQVSFDMEKVKQLFDACESPEIKIYTPHMIILRSGIVETTFCRDGRMLIKKVATESEARCIALKLLQTALPAVIKR